VTRDEALSVLSRIARESTAAFIATNAAEDLSAGAVRELE
jgi:hypothetical protein